jgi:hypothetical protein
MLTIPTVLKPSLIHGIGCFAGVRVAEGDLVWVLDLRVDGWMGREPEGRWEWEHCYCSHSQAIPAWVLPRDNAAYINFSDVPSLREGPVVNGEPCLVAAREIAPGEEITVAPSTDADYDRKMQRSMVII